MNDEFKNQSDRDYFNVGDFHYYHSLPDNPPKWALINSSGGIDRYATPVYDYILHHGMSTIASGTCQSFGFTVFTAGKRRVSMPSTVFMIHGPGFNKPWWKFWDDKNQQKALTMFRLNFEDKWLDRMEKISNMPRQFWRDMIRDPHTHYYLTAHELKKMGVVTHIVGEDI